MKWDGAKPRTENSSSGAGGHNPQSPSEDAIRDRAFEIYLARGAKSGDRVTDWLQAERELRAKAQTGATTETKSNAPQRSVGTRPTAATHRA